MLVSLAAGLLCLAVLVGKTARAGLILFKKRDYAASVEAQTRAR